MGDELVIDFALVAVREDGLWTVTPLPPAAADDLDHLVHVLHQQPGEVGAIGMLSVADDFFVLVRVRGDDVRMLLSDATAAYDSRLAEQVLERLDLPMPSGDDIDDVEPAGSLDLLADLGISAMALSALCADLDVSPDDQLAEIAAHLGCARQYDDAVELAV